MPVAWEQIEPLLMKVARPARYVGGEFNQIVKAEARVRCLLAFPDLYEIGMSYHGYRILYERLNAVDGWAAERTYAPWPDFEAQLREHGVQLYSMETRRTLAEFDWVGFTLQHEVNFTNLLTMIDLGGLALESKDRTEPFPLLIGGGEGAFSPEPLAPFLDAFVIGDGEEVVMELMEFCERARFAGWDRPRVLRELANIPGIYVPAFYEPVYHEDGKIREIRIAPEFAQNPPPSPVRKRHYYIAKDEGAVRPVVPLIRTVHDRLAIEIRRGCVNNCRFCQAGMITRPVGERPLEQIVEIARQGIANTGYDEVSLLSLSSADYTMIAPLVKRMTDEFGPSGVSVSLPSLRINGFDVALVDEIARIRKSGFTFAPEAGTTRLRQVINKPVDQDRFFEIIEDVFHRGWRTVKFYFMIGLPTETDEDLDGIIEICEKAALIGRRYHGGRVKINVTLSPFVPKPMTPFQWEPQPPVDELERRYQYVKREVNRRVGRVVDIKTPDTGAAFIEAVLARGDREVAAAIRRAWELGGRFDGWDEYFNLEIWLKAFKEVGIDPAFYANRQREEHEVFPFEHIESNVGRRFFWADARRAWREIAMEKCDTNKCAGCAVCTDELNHTLADAAQTYGKYGRKLRKNASNGSGNGDPAISSASLLKNLVSSQEAAEAMSRLQPEEGDIPEAVDISKDSARRLMNEECDESSFVTAEEGELDGLRGVMRMRLTYTKLGGLKYLSHLDLAKVVSLIVRRAGLPIAYSQGYNPQPRIMFAPPLSLGMGGEAELVDIHLTRLMPPEEVIEALNGIELEGMRFVEAEEIPLSSPSLESQIMAACYEVECLCVPGKLALGDVFEKIETFKNSEQFLADVAKKNGTKRLDLKESILALEADEPVPRLYLTITHEPGRFVKPHEALSAILGMPLELGADLRINRAGFVLNSNPSIAETAMA